MLFGIIKNIFSLEMQEDEEHKVDSSNRVSNSDNKNDYATLFYDKRDVLDELIADHQFRRGFYY